MDSDGDSLFSIALYFILGVGKALAAATLVVGGIAASMLGIRLDIFLREQPTAITEYDEPLIRRLIEKATAYEDKFTVEFKSGVTVDVNE